MSLQDIGLNAVFQDKDFQRGINNYQKEVDSAEKVTDKASSRMSGLGDIAGKAAVIGIGAATAGVAAFVAAAKFGVDALNSWNDQVNTLSDNLGTTGEQSAVWAAAFNHVGLTVDEGAGGLNFFTRGLDDLRTALNEGKDLTPFGKALDKLGVSAFGADGKLRTFDEVMPDLLDSFQQMPAGIDKSALAMELFGSKAGTKFIDFLSQGSEGLEHARQMVKDFGLGLTTEKSGAIEEFGFAMNDLQLGFQGFMAQIGLAVLPVLKELAVFVMGNILPVLADFGQLVKDVFGFLRTGDASDILTDLVEAFNIDPDFALGFVIAIENIREFVLALVDLGHQLFLVLTGQAELFEDFGSDFAGLFGENEAVVWNFAHGLASAGLLIRDTLSAVWKFIQPILQDVFGELAKFWTEVQPRLQKAWDNIYNNIIVPVITAIAQFIREHGKEIRDVFEGIWQVVSGIFQTAWALISGIVKIALDLLGGDMEAAGRDWDELVAGVWEGIQNIFKGAWKAIGQFVLAALIALNQALNDKMEEARQGIVDKLNEAIDWLRNLPATMVQVGYDIIQGLIDGFFQQAGAVQTALADIVQAAINNILDSLGLGGLGMGFNESATLGLGRGRSFATNAALGLGAGDNNSSRVVNIAFYGQGGPTNEPEARASGNWIAETMKSRGVES